MAKPVNMSSITDDEVRHGILEILCKLAKEDPGSMLDRKKMQKLLKISEKRMDFNMLYLEEKGLVKLHKVWGSLWQAAEITAHGIDVLQHKDRYSREFPFVRTTIQKIYGDVYGPVVQAVESQVNFSQQLATAFQQARSMTKTKEDIRSTLREEIEKHLNLLEEELRRKECDAGKIQRLWEWLKRNADWVVPTLAQVVSESTRIALG